MAAETPPAVGFQREAAKPLPPTLGMSFKTLFRLLLSVAVAASCLALASSSPTGDQSELQRRLQEARALAEKGSNQEARKIYDSLLPALRQQGDSADLATALNALSSIANAQGDYAYAIQAGQESAAVFRRLGDKRGVVRALDRVGLAHSYRGTNTDATVIFEQALSLSQQIGDAEDEVAVRNNLGDVFYFEGRYLDAMRSYEQQMKVVNQHPSDAWSGYWKQVTDFNLATVYHRLGREERALEIYREIQKSPGQLKPGDLAQLSANLGALYRRLGDPMKALESYKEAERLFAQEHNADGEIGVVKNIGIVKALDLADLNGALGVFDVALARAVKTNDRQETMQVRLYRGETLFRLHRFEAARQEFEAVQSLAENLGTAEERWKSHYGLGRVAAAFGRDSDAESQFRLAIADIESVRAQLQLQSLKSDFLADKRDVYDALIKRLLDQGATAAAFQFMERSRARNFQDRLREPTGDADPGSAPRLQGIQSKLDGATLLLDFWSAGDQLGVVWLTHDSSGSAQRSLAAGRLAQITDFLRGMPESLGEDWKKNLAVLEDLLPPGVKPLGDAHFRHLLIVPDGILSSVPFELLRDPGSGQMLVERFDVSYLPTASLLLRSARGPGSLRPPWSHELLAFGDPVIGQAEAPSLRDVLSGPSPSTALPYSAEEVRSIAKLCPGRAELYLGPANLKRAFLDATGKYPPLLHISTHAAVDADDPERSRLLFSPASSRAPDDYLFLKEFYELDLRGVDLATISACNTERGKMVRGEGVQAFSRVLLSAGSRSTVTTLWQVADQPTAEFMKQFYYFAVAKRMPKAEALRLAKLKFLHSKGTLQHPRYWAAFVLNGETRYSRRRLPLARPPAFSI
jgi:CHAT domain-containing protein/Tfp pilus assembly protein PilF